MKDYIKLIDGMPWIVRLLLALPVLDGIVYGIYRIAKGRLIIGLIWIFIGASIFWIIDMATIIVNGKVTFLV